ncbi:MAG: HEAT repeat domain-containing protein [Planctomycetes bacterium]|nr:HEAT repeat domain-containing protein [Planctomycetota bacterium]
MPITLTCLALLAVALPADVRSELDGLRRGSRPGEPARVEVARAALAAGELAVFVAELDAVLARDPDLPAARELVARAPLALSLPAEAGRSLERRLVLFGARAQPTYRELAAARLAGEPRDGVLEELGHALRSPSPNVRAFTAFALRRIDPRVQADALVRVAVLDPCAATRREAARTLRDARDETLVLRVAAALALDDALPRANAAAALGEIGHAAALPLLVGRLAALQSGGHPGGTRAHVSFTRQAAYVRDFEPQIAQGASIADPLVDVATEGTVLDVRVVTSHVRVEVERRALCAALQRISGARLPLEPGRWLAWWEARRSTPTSSSD